MINVIIVEDSSMSRIVLEKILKLRFKDKITAIVVCETVDEAIIAIKKFKPQLVFLDIEMPNKNGFDLLNEIGIVDFEVIFTTSHAEYAIKALQANAVDYLIKPIKLDELSLALQRFELKFSKKIGINHEISNKIESSSGGEILNKIALPTQNGYEFLKVNSIMYCEASSNYCKIICSDGKEILLAKTLKNIQLLLPEKLFQRIHKSYLVNLNFIARCSRSKTLEIELLNGKILPISHRKRNTFLNVFKNKI